MMKYKPSIDVNIKMCSSHCKIIHCQALYDQIEVCALIFGKYNEHTIFPISRLVSRVEEKGGCMRTSYDKVLRRII
jgi:hypothetical protein